MPNDKERIPWKLERLLHLNDPTFKSSRPDARDLAEDEEWSKVDHLVEIRRGYKWEWNAGAKYLFEELIRAYGLDAERRELLIEISKSKPGRKHAVNTALRIAEMKQERKTAKEIAKELGISVEGVESYSKRRRKPSTEEQVRKALKRAMARRVKSPGDSSR